VRGDRRDDGGHSAYSGNRPSTMPSDLWATVQRRTNGAWLSQGIWAGPW